MIKFITTAKNGTRVIGLGLSAGNMYKLKQGEPMLLHLDDLGIEGIDVLIHYGDTEESIMDDFRKHGLLP